MDRIKWPGYLFILFLPLLMMRIQSCFHLLLLSLQSNLFDVQIVVFHIQQ